MSRRHMGKSRSVVLASINTPGRRRFASGSGASAWVEYAVLLGLFVGARVPAHQFLAPVMPDSLSEAAAVGDAVGRPAHAAPARSGPQPGQFPQAASVSRQSPPGRLTGWYAALAAAIVVWYLLHRRRRAGDRKKPEQDASLPSLPRAQRRTPFGSHVEVRHLMTRDPVSVEPAAPARKVAKMMAVQGIRHLLVRSSAGKLLGVISDSDVQDRRGETARDLMTADPITVPPDAAVGPAISTLLERNISCLPVVEEGVPVGILTTTDLFVLLQCTLQVLGKLAAERELPWNGRGPAGEGDGPLPNTISAHAARGATQDAEGRGDPDPTAPPSSGRSEADGRDIDGSLGLDRDG
jgi:CBS domain-containing protein